MKNGTQSSGRRLPFFTFQAVAVLLRARAAEQEAVAALAQTLDLLPEDAPPL